MKLIVMCVAFQMVYCLLPVGGKNVSVVTMKTLINLPQLSGFYAHSNGLRSLHLPKHQYRIQGQGHSLDSIAVKRSAQ